MTPTPSTSHHNKNNCPHHAADQADHQVRRTNQRPKSSFHSSRMVTMTTLFDRLDARRPLTEDTQQMRKDPAQQLLTWIVKSGRQKITTREVRNYAPHPLRTRESA